MNFKKHFLLKFIIVIFLNIAGFQKSFSIGNVFLESFYKNIAAVLRLSINQTKICFGHAETELALNLGLGQSINYLQNA